MVDELSAPLGRRKAKGRRWMDLSPRVPLTRLSLALVGLLVGGAVLRVMTVDDPMGGRPQAEVAINTAAPHNPLAAALSTEGLTAGPEFPASPSITTLGGDGLAEADIGPDPGLVPDANGVLPDLVEETQYGPIPRMGPTGKTPFQAYARPSITPAAANGRPLVAIVVTGLGLNEQGTLDAVDALPDNVTLAFAPYGKTLDNTVAAARNGGHEVMLELPLEPFDYPENDPGPETLLTGQPPRANLDKLFWLMARMGGYIGVINHLGARFTASGGDFGPLMEELGTRGLAYLDDGSSNRSLAPQLAQSNKVPFARGDMMLDANPSRAPILAALDALEAKARANGSAVGIVSALPISIQTVAEWARGLEDKGVILVPVSALMQAN